MSPAFRTRYKYKKTRDSRALGSAARFLAATGTSAAGLLGIPRNLSSSCFATPMFASLLCRQNSTWSSEAIILRMDVGARTDVGRVRENNEDAFRIAVPQKLYVVSDGMGGEAHGEVASELAVNTIVEQGINSLGNSSLSLSGQTNAALSERTNRLASAVHLANEKIHAAGIEHPDQYGMGATVVAAWVDGDHLSVAHVGDSRIYLLRGGEFRQITGDHSLVAEQVRYGLLTPEQAENSHYSNVLTRALGPHAQVEVDAAEYPIQAGDTLLLCTDGLTRMVNDATIGKMLVGAKSAQQAADQLVDAANEKGGNDNVTVVVIRALPDPIDSGEKPPKKDPLYDTA